MATLTLTLDSDCPWKTELVDTEGNVLYDIKTSFNGDTNYTVIRNDRDEILATLRWREFFPDQIMRNGGRFVSENSWLKKSLVPMNYNVKLKDDAGRGYVWTGDAPGLLLQLFTAEDRSTSIATYHRSHLDTSTKPPVRVLPTLELTGRAQEVRDLVVISFVCLEKGRRTEETNKRMMAGRMMGAWGA